MNSAYPPPRIAGKVDRLIMRGLSSTFANVLTPIGVRGFATIASRVARLRRNPLAKSSFGGGASFLHPIYDSYWGHYYLSGLTYEPDVRALLDRLIARNIHFAFIDGGANFGFWSCYLSQRPDLVKPIVAVEPTPETFAILCLNAAVNEDRFLCLQNAISDTDGGQVTMITGRYHAGNRVVAPGEAYPPPGGTIVSSVSVDGIIERTCIDTSLIVIKLDVEGLEPQALAGARKAIDAGNPVIYECHGSDLSCSASRAAMSLGLAVYFLTDSGRSIPIGDLESLRSLKTNPHKGYNLVGIQPGSRFESLMAGP